MFLLSLFWLLLGCGVGLLALAAQLHSQRVRNVSLLVIGALTACAGGWLGTWMLGRYFATAMALWIAVLCSVGVLVMPNWLVRLRAPARPDSTTLLYIHLHTPQPYRHTLPAAQHTDQPGTDQEA